MNRDLVINLARYLFSFSHISSLLLYNLIFYFKYVYLIFTWKLLGMGTMLYCEAIETFSWVLIEYISIL